MESDSWHDHVGPMPRQLTEQQGVHIMKDLFWRLVKEEDGMEMVEWAIVGVVFAVAAAAFWGELSDAIDLALNDIEAEVTPAG
jgi:Flp pilus assembly pilin Flp